MQRPNLKDYQPSEIEILDNHWTAYANDRDARIAEAERIMRSDLLIDTGQAEPQGYCMVCGQYGDSVEKLQHLPDCALNNWLMER